MEYTLKPAADRLAALLGDVKVTLAPDVIGEEVKAIVDANKAGEIVVLENVRFYEEEGKKCTPEAQEAFAKSWQHSATFTFLTHSAQRTALTLQWLL